MIVIISTCPERRRDEEAATPMQWQALGHLLKAVEVVKHSRVTAQFKVLVRDSLQHGHSKSSDFIGISALPPPC